MAHPWHHALSSEKRLHAPKGSHLPLHNLLDSSKMAMADPRHRGLLHHKAGVLLAKRVFPNLEAAAEIAEEHIREDLGEVPLPSKWIEQMPDLYIRAFYQNPNLQLPEPETFILNNPFQEDAQDGLREVCVILTLPEKAEPELIKSPTRLLWFHSAGPFLCEAALGPIISPSRLPTRVAAEWIIRSVLRGSIPPFHDIASASPIQNWMFQKAAPLSTTPSTKE